MTNSKSQNNTNHHGFILQSISKLNDLHVVFICIQLCFSLRPLYQNRRLFLGHDTPVKNRCHKQHACSMTQQWGFSCQRSCIWQTHGPRLPRSCDRTRLSHANRSSATSDTGKTLIQRQFGTYLNCDGICVYPEALDRSTKSQIKKTSDLCVTFYRIPSHIYRLEYEGCTPLTWPGNHPSCTKPPHNNLKGSLFNSLEDVDVDLT